MLLLAAQADEDGRQMRASYSLIYGFLPTVEWIAAKEKKES